MGAILILLSVAKGLTGYLVEAEIAARLLEWVRPTSTRACSSCWPSTCSCWSSAA